MLGGFSQQIGMREHSRLWTGDKDKAGIQAGGHGKPEIQTEWKKIKSLSHVRLNNLERSG